MSSRSLSLSLLFWYIQYLNVIYSHRCGHDDVEYDIFRNDDIEPESISHTVSSKTSPNTKTLSKLASAMNMSYSDLIKLGED